MRPKYRVISTLFTQTLKINSATWSDLTVELGELRESETQNFAAILDVYKNLHQMNIFPFVEDLRYHNLRKFDVYVQC